MSFVQYTTGNEDYEQIFPEDAYGDECGEDARVFKVYDAESKMQDTDMIGQSSDSSDVLLVFVRTLPNDRASFD